MSNEQIFISYARENTAQAEALIRVLQSNMWSVWWDDASIEVGAKYRNETKEALMRAECVVTLWSEDSVVSTWVQAEASTALEAKKLLPVRLDAAEIPMPFGELQTADLTTWDGAERDHRGLQRLLSSISKRFQPRVGLVSVDAGQSVQPSDRGQTFTTLADVPWADSFDEVYVISDLDLGSAPSLQVMNQGDRLSKLIEHLTHVRATDRVALVINGDLIDFASEDFDGLVATHEVVTILEKVWRTEGFRRVWERLAAFAQTPRRYLIIVLGEKDMELALPNASEAIIRKLTGDEISARGRTILVGLSASFKCRVGHANVLCKHGHDADRWNAVDYGLLSLLGNQQTDGSTIMDAGLVANAGRLVSRKFMNSVKAQYPFLAFLKPEATAAVTTLLTLQPSIFFRWPLLMPQVLMRLFSIKAKINEHVALEQSDSTAKESVLLPLFWLLPWKRNRTERLRKYLLALHRKDTTFSLTKRDGLFASIVGSVSTEFDFIATGHTHLERAIEIENTGRFYYNTGTWAPLLRFNHTLLSSAESFDNILKSMAGKDMNVLDELTVPMEDGGEMPFVLHRPTVLRISSNPRGVVGQLFHVFDSGHDAVRLEPLAGTEFWKK